MNVFISINFKKKKKIVDEFLKNIYRTKPNRSASIAVYLLAPPLVSVKTAMLSPSASWCP